MVRLPSTALELGSQKAKRGVRLSASTVGAHAPAPSCLDGLVSPEGIRCHLLSVTPLAQAQGPRFVPNSSCHTPPIPGTGTSTWHGSRSPFMSWGEWVAPLCLPPHDAPTPPPGPLKHRNPIFFTLYPKAYLCLAHSGSSAGLVLDPRLPTFLLWNSSSPLL